MTYIPNQGYTSSINSSTSPLTNGSTFTGTAELITAPDVAVSCKTDQDGVLYFDFSQDGTNWDTFPVNGFTVTANVHEFHKAVKIDGRYFRVRLTNNSGSNQTLLRLKTYYGRFGLPNAPLNQSISSDSDAINVRAIGAGLEPDGTYSDIKRTGVAASSETVLNDTDVWNSGVIDTEGYEMVEISLYGDQPFTRQLIFYESDQTTQLDGSTRTVPLNISGNTVARELLAVTPRSRYMRVIVTNDSGSNMTVSSFSITLHSQPIGDSQLPLDIPLRDGATAGLTRAIQVGRQPDGDYVNSPADGSAFSTTSALSGGATYTSDWVDTDGWKAIEIVVTSDVVSANDGVQVQFTDDVQAGTPTVRTQLVYTLSANDVSNGSLVIRTGTLLDGFRIVYTNGSSAQSVFFLEASLRTAAVGTTRVSIESEIAPTSVAAVTRAIIVAENAAGDYSNIQKDIDTNSLNVNVANPLTAFGELQVSNISPSVQLLFTYSVNSELVLTRNNGGTTTVADGQISCSTGAAANQTGGFISRDLARYNPGQGIMARFTGLFTTGVANSTQWIGIGDAYEGFFFGYSGSSFGVLHRKGGKPEIRTLTVTTGSSHGENITITLNSNADATVAVTNTADTTLTANEIAAHDYSGVGSGWTAKAVGNTVVFTSYASGAKSGTYSLSGATSAVGTFAQTIAGVSATDDFIAQTSWNGDPADNSRALPTLDPTTGNVFQIQYQYLGYGLIKFSIEDPDSGRFITVHKLAYANANTTPSMVNPSQHLGCFASNASNTTNISVKTASMMAGSEGQERLPGIRRGTSSSKSGITTSEVPVMTIRNSEVYNSRLNSIPIKMFNIAASNDHTKAMRIRVLRNATLTGASFAAIESSVSPLFKDTTATAVSGGTELFALELGSNNNDQIPLFADALSGVIDPGDTITITARAVSGTGAICSASINWVEQQ